jgi:hypothetical protein
MKVNIYNFKIKSVLTLFEFNSKISVVFLLVSFVNSHIAMAQSISIYQSYAILKINGGSNTYYDLGATTANPDFQGNNLGSFSTSQTLVLAGVELKTNKCNGGNVTGGNIYYRVYETSSSAGAFSTAIATGFISNDGGTCGGDQTWRKDNNTTDVKAGLTSGTYYLEVYANATGSPATVFANNGGNNYKATFTVCSPPTAFNMTGGGTYCSGGSGVPVDLTGSETGITYQLKVDGVNTGSTVSGTGSALSFGNQTAAGVYTVLAANGTCTTLITNNGSTPQVPTSGLVAYYPFSGNANDASSFGNNGVITNATPTIDRFGVSNAAYSFNGTNSIIQAPDAPQLRPKNLTLSHWAYINNAAPLQAMVGKAYATTNCDAYTSFLIEGRFAGTSCYAIAQDALPSNYLNTISAPINTWKYVTYQFDDDNNLLKLYIDGLPVASFAWNSPLVYDNTPLQIGGERDNGNLTYFFGGKLDDIRLYNRVLSDSEIKALFEEGTNKTVVSIQPQSAPTLTLQRTSPSTVLATVGNVGNNNQYNGYFNG